MIEQKIQNIFELLNVVKDAYKTDDYITSLVIANEVERLNQELVSILIKLTVL